MFRLLQIAALLACVVYGNVAAGAADKISLYSHYTTAPFAVEGVPPQLSYTVRLAAWLTAQSAGRYLFEARQMPRLRLNRIVAQADWQGVVAWDVEVANQLGEVVASYDILTLVAKRG